MSDSISLVTSARWLTDLAKGMMCNGSTWKMRLKSKTIAFKTTHLTLNPLSIKDLSQSSKPNKRTKINTISDYINQPTCCSMRRANYKGSSKKTCVVKSMRKSSSSRKKNSNSVSKITCLSKMLSKLNKKSSRISWKPTAKTSNGTERNLISSGGWGVSCKLMAICRRLRSISTSRTCRHTKATNWLIILTCLAWIRKVSQSGKRAIVPPRLK